MSELSRDESSIATARAGRTAELASVGTDPVGKRRRAFDRERELRASAKASLAESQPAPLPPERRAIAPIVTALNKIMSVQLADNDLPGRKHVQHVAKNLHGVAKTVRVVDFAPHWPGEAMPVGHDVVEWFEQHDRAGSRLALLAKDEPLWAARADDRTGTGEDAGGGAEEDTDDG